MDIAFCIGKIAEYATKQGTVQGELSGIEDELIKATEAMKDGKPDAKDAAAAVRKTLYAQLTAKKLILGYLNDFISFWKDELKKFLSQIKQFNELAQGGR